MISNKMRKRLYKYVKDIKRFRKPRSFYLWNFKEYFPSIELS